MFNSLNDGSCTTSLTLQDQVFPVAYYFDMEAMSLMLNTDIPVSGSPCPISR